MSRLLVLGAIVAAAVLVPMTHTAFAAPAAKVKVCHLNSSNTAAAQSFAQDYNEHYFGYDYSSTYSYTYTYSFGNVIEVADSAVDAHLGHGDDTAFWALDQWVIDYVSSWSQYNYSYSYSWDYRPDYDYYGSYSYSGTYTDGVIKNADCYIYDFTYTQ